MLKAILFFTLSSALAAQAQAGTPIACENEAIFLFGSPKAEAAVMCANGANAYAARVCVIEFERDSSTERSEALQLCASGKTFYESKICLDESQGLGFSRSEGLEICGNSRRPIEVKLCVSRMLTIGVERANAFLNCH